MRLFHITLLSLSLAFVAACGEDARPPFVLQINSQDIVQTAVDRIEIVMRPMPAGTRFAAQADMSDFGGTVASRVTGAGEFAINVEQAYVDANARPGDLMNAFFVDVPILLSDDTAQQSVEDPLTEVTFIRGSERIGNAERFLDWPLVDGGQAVFRVMCDRPTYSRQCTNNDPIPVADSGTMMPDGGAGDGG
jgi:hypothetical protein